MIRQEKTDAYDLKESAANIGTGLIYKVLDALSIIFIGSVIYLAVQSYGFQWQSSSPLLNFILLMVLVDFNFYWVHRFMHKVRYGWAGHWVHHSSERFNFSTALRQTPVVSFNGIMLVAMLPAAVIGFSLEQAVIALELNLFFQFFVHTEVVRKLPHWFEFVFNTPSHHRVHHGSNPKQIDTNFAGVLIIWDRLFGTFVDEKDAGEIRYGVDFRPANSLNPFRLVIAEFVSMWRDILHYRDIRILWKHPSWVEEHYGRK
ncbi:MAG: sterol desaturase [Thalassolituus sp. CG17_big_fil_post_rev_8_21_14_2_50_53_8]|nr:MAG: sterol desaturase [Thalassolituus sp. CG17_big_fil_post_rev_8_21_14_2_50_53_8]